MSNTRLYKNGRPPSNPKSLTRRDIVRDSAKFKTVEREHDPLRRFGGSVGAAYIDSDGDGSLDKIIRVTRGGSLGISKYPETPVSTDPPVSGPSGLTATEAVPVSGPSGLTATQQIDPTVSGPSGLTATENVPVSGPSGLTATEAVPASGPSGLTATEAIPVSGPSGLTATKLTLNIAPLSTDQYALVATTPAVGTIKYSSDIDRLFIYDGTDWHNYL